jgi:hypothetical protein
MVELNPTSRPLKALATLQQTFTTLDRYSVILYTQSLSNMYRYTLHKFSGLVRMQPTESNDGAWGHEPEAEAESVHECA